MSRNTIILIYWTIFLATLPLDSSKRCRQRLHRREVETWINDKRPCCLPDTWKSQFIVQTLRIGSPRYRVDHGAFRMRRNDFGAVRDALLVVGKTVSSPEFCDLEVTSNLTEILCPKDRIRCLKAPFLGEPRCLTANNGYQLQRSEQTKTPGKIIQTWFIDKQSMFSGLVERHLYHVIRMYGFCKLQRYEIQWGFYVSPWKTCRLFERKEQTYRPVGGTFKLKFQHSLTDGLLFC